MNPRQSAAEEGAARFEAIVIQPKKVYHRVAFSDTNDNVIAEASLRSPENVFEVVEDYPAPYVMLDGVYTAPKHRGQGYACQLIRLLLEHASRQPWHVFCRPLPYGRGKMSRAALFDFYRGLGWQVDPYNMLNVDWLVWRPGPRPRWPQGAHCS